MAEGFESMHSDLNLESRALPKIREEELKVSGEECISHFQALSGIMQEQGGDQDNGSLAIIHQSLMEQKINEAVAYQLQRFVRLEEFGIHGPRYTKQLVGMNGSKAEQEYFRSFQKLMQKLAIRIGHDFDLTTDLKPPSQLRFKAKILQQIDSIYLPMTGEASYQKNDIVTLNKTDFEFLEKQLYAVKI